MRGKLDADSTPSFGFFFHFYSDLEVLPGVGIEPTTTWLKAERSTIHFVNNLTL